MKNKKNVKLIVLLCFLFISVFLSFVYIVKRYDSIGEIGKIKDDKNIVVGNNESNNSSVNMGDISEPVLGDSPANCTSTRVAACGNGYKKIDGICYMKVPGMTQTTCAYAGLKWDGRTCYSKVGPPDQVCIKCISGYYLIGGSCVHCHNGYSGWTSDGKDRSSCQGPGNSVASIGGSTTIICTGRSVTDSYRSYNSAGVLIKANSWGGAASCSNTDSCSATFGWNGQCNGSATTSSVTPDGVSKNVTVYHYNPWSVVGEYTYSSLQSPTYPAATVTGCYSYSCSSNGNGRYTCTKYYRCCGSGVGDTPSNPQNNNPTPSNPQNNDPTPSNPQPDPVYCWIKRGNGTDNQYKKSTRSPGSGWENLGQRSDCGESPSCYVINGRESIGYYSGQGYGACTPGCWGNSGTIASSTTIHWGYSTDTLGLTVKFSNVNNANDCEIMPEPTVCNPQEISETPTGGNMNTCEGKTSIKYKSGKTCSSGSSFYDITCQNEIITDFDLGEDGVYNTQISIKPGQGFKYGIAVSKEKKCTGTFNVSTWNSAYNALNDKQRKQTSNGDADWNRLENKKKALQDIASSYNDYRDIDNSIPAATMEFSASSNKEISFISTVIDDETNSTKKEANALANGTKVHDYTNTYSKKFMIMPSNMYFDYRTGKESSSKTLKVVDGGNKVYTDLKTTPNNYSIAKIQVSNLDNNKTSINLSNVCDIHVYDTNLTYRIIEVSNPFVNSKYPVGVNWLSDKYNYTKVIRSNTWSTSPLYVFNLANEDILSIKRSNASYPANTYNPSNPNENSDTDEYLGICNYLDESKQDEITKKLCHVMK